MTGYGSGGYPYGGDGSIPPAAGSANLPQPYSQPYGNPMPYVPPYQQPVYVQPQYGQPSPYAAPMPYSPYGQAAVPGALYGVDPLTGIPLSDKSKSTAGLLQLFFGGFGVGRLYLGHTGIGVAQLMLTLFGLITTLFIVGGFILFGVGVWILIDAIMIFTGSVRDSNGRVLR